MKTESYNPVKLVVQELRNAAPDHYLLDIEKALTLVTAIFHRAGVPEGRAFILAKTCVHAERDGAHSHGLYRLPAYLATLSTNWVNAGAAIITRETGTSTTVVDAQNGFAQPALAEVADRLIDKAAKTGVSMMLMKNSHHFGALWLDVEPFARKGFVAWTSVNSTSHMAPSGGTEPVYGTNPMAFACPRKDAPPIVFDQASSVMAKGDIQLAAKHGQMLPNDTGLDKHGQPTLDPNEILDGGALLPFGGHKGSSLAMMVEVLSAALTGAHFSWEIDKSGYTNAHTSRAGQFLLCIDPRAGGENGFAERINTMAQKLIQSGQTRLPGDRRYTNRNIAQREGIPVNPTQLLSWYDGSKAT